MTTLSLYLDDSATMLRRRLRRMMRYPSILVLLIGEPVLLLFLFVYVFGDTLGSGLDGSAAGRAAYVDYVTPGILLMTVAFAALGTPISVAMDMTQGIFTRFRTMAISRPSVLTGHVLGAIIQTALGLIVIIGVALLIGWRPTASPLEWFAAIGVLAAIAWALTWLMVALGLASGSVEASSSTPLPIVFLPFLSSAFVPTDSMPSWLRWFADYQPFTPFIETLRGLLMGTPIGSSAALAGAWCVVITIVGFLWARRLFNREPAQ